MTYFIAANPILEKLELEEPSPGGTNSLGLRYRTSLLVRFDLKHLGLSIALKALTAPLLKLFTIFLSKIKISNTVNIRLSLAEFYCNNTISAI